MPGAEALRPSIVVLAGIASSARSAMSPATAKTTRPPPKRSDRFEDAAQAANAGIHERRHAEERSAFPAARLGAEAAVGAVQGTAALIRRTTWHPGIDHGTGVRGLVG